MNLHCPLCGRWLAETSTGELRVWCARCQYDVVFSSESDEKTTSYTKPRVYVRLATPNRTGYNNQTE